MTKTRPTPTLPTNSDPRPNPGVLIVLCLAQLIWLFWVLSEPLPNAGGGLTRGYLLWHFLPEVIPGVTWSQSFLGNMLNELSHIENLPQRVPIVAAGTLILAAAFGFGRLVLRGLKLKQRLPQLECLALAYGLGMTALGLFALILGRLGWLTPLTTWLALLTLIGVEFALSVRDRIKKTSLNLFLDPPAGSVAPSSLFTLFLCITPFLLAMALGSMLPTIDFDAVEYHIQGPKEYYLNGQITYLPHNVYTCMPFNIEMLHLIGMNVVRDWWLGALVGQLLVASFAPMAGLAVWLTARRWGSPRAAWVAAVVYLSIPWIYRLASIPYVEGPLCYYHAILVLITGMAWNAPPDLKTRLWAIIGSLAGGSMAIKYPALISAVIPFGAVSVASAWRDRSVKVVLALSIGVLVVMGPWMAKNVYDTGNPLYPLAYNIFGGRDWDAGREAKWENAHGRKPIEAKAFVNSVLDVAARSDWQSPALFALAPLAFLRRSSRRTSYAIAALSLYIFMTWWLLTHRLDRFWLPLLPAVAVLAGLGFDWTKAKGWTILASFVLAVSILVNFIDCSTPLTGLNEWTGNLQTMKTGIPQILNPPLARLDTILPTGAKPLLVGQAAVFHLTHDVVYNTVFDRDIFESIDDDRSPGQVRDELARRGISHIYVDWSEITRYRSPGNYGFTDYVTPERFDRLVKAGVLSEAKPMGAEPNTSRQQLFTVLSNR